MHDICVVTGTRAEYNLLYPLIKRIEKTEDFNMRLAVTGSHLSEKYGNTYRDILEDGVHIDVKIPILSEDDTTADINSAMSRCIEGFDRYFKKTNIDLVLILGDRYELLSVAIVAMNYRIPIGHISCGDTTEGAIDECIRHSITKMSSIMFPGCEEYRRRVIQLGENPNRVFNVGELGVENAIHVKKMTLGELSESLNFDLSGKFAVLTFHPVTLEEDTTENEFQQLLESLDSFPDVKIVFTKSNADTGGLLINKMIDEYVNNNPDRCVSVFNLGRIRYLSALSYACVVIGNSSSGIIETPSFAVPTVNIGDRQKGRLQAQNVINCDPSTECIKAAISKALSDDFKNDVKDIVSPYGDGNASAIIVEKIKYFFAHPEVFPLKKGFYDLKFDI